MGMKLLATLLAAFLLVAVARAVPLLFPIVVHGKVGYIDGNGKVVIAPRYPYYCSWYDEGECSKQGVTIPEFSEGLAAACPDTRTCGYIDGAGDFAIKPTLGEARRFYAGMAVVGVGDCPSTVAGPDCDYTIIDRSGKIVGLKDFRRSDIFKSRLERTGPGYLWGYTDKSGSRLEDLQDFSDGLAAFQIKEKWGYMNESGKIVIAARFDNANGFSNGLAAVESGSKYGFIDRSGKWVVPPVFDTLSSFSQGLAAAGSGGRIGYIDRTGSFVIQPRFFGAGDFSEGLAPAMIGGKWGFIDRLGRFIIEPRFAGAKSFHDGLAAVSVKSTPEYKFGWDEESKWGYVNKRGWLVTPAIFDAAEDFRNGMGQVWFEKPGSDLNVGYVNASGGYIWNPVPSK